MQDIPLPDYFIILRAMYKDILAKLPYKSTFRFVDEILFLNADGVKGNYTLQQDAFFYPDHFPGYPVTPGVIITEIMAQTGLVVLGIYLLQQQESSSSDHEPVQVIPLLTATEVSFHKMVLPGAKLTITSQKKYFRFNKLKCYIEMHDQENDLVAKGMFSGMIKKLSKPVTV